MPKTPSPLSVEFAARLTEKFHTENSIKANHNHAHTVEVEALIKVDRITIVSYMPEYSDASGSKSSYAFVDKVTGELIKCAGWKAPAKVKSGAWQSQYNLTTDMDKAVGDADPYGGFLYAR